MDLSKKLDLKSLLQVHNVLVLNYLLPLIDETAAKIHTLAPCDAQTGPARRGDENVMHHHLSLLNDDQQKVYSLLSEEIRKRNR